MQTLTRKREISHLIEQYDHIVVDECQQRSAVSFDHLLRQAKARYVSDENLYALHGRMSRKPCTTQLQAFEALPGDAPQGIACHRSVCRRKFRSPVARYVDAGDASLVQKAPCGNMPAACTASTPASQMCWFTTVLIAAIRPSNACGRSASVATRPWGTGSIPLKETSAEGK